MEDLIKELEAKYGTDKNKWDWSDISKYQKLSEAFIREFQNKVHWSYISECQKLSEAFIREFQDKVQWSDISSYQKLSEAFIREFQDKVDWDYISKYQKLSEEFRNEFNLTIPDTCWLYKDIEFKREYVLKNTDYALEGDYILAFKSCRSDGYSKYNFQYHYEVGGVYESMADHNVDNENSYGLSAWSLKGAKEYCTEKVFKVKIHLDDVACFVHNNHKIRATKIHILEEIM